MLGNFGSDRRVDDTSNGAPSDELLNRTIKAAGRSVVAGQPAPSFDLPDLHGGAVALPDLTRVGPVVISFYRGFWCNFCETAIEALARINDDIREAGATFVAIGPAPGNDAERTRLNAFPMPILVDRSLSVFKAYGLTVELPDELRGHYERLGCPQPYASRSKKWLVPIPATYLISRGGRIELTNIDADYRKRIDPAVLLSALRSLRRAVAA